MNSERELPLTDAEIRAVRRLIKEHTRFGPPARPPLDMEKLHESNRAIIEAMKKRRLRGLTVDGDPEVKGLTADAD